MERPPPQRGMTFAVSPRNALLWALVGAALFSLESWALGPYSWIYSYGSGLETIPALLALGRAGMNFSAWAPFVAGGVDRLAFWGNADLFSLEVLMFKHLPVWLANGLHRFLQYFIGIYFTSRVLRDDFGFAPREAMVGGWLFGAFSYFTVGALLTLPGVPALAWAISRLARANANPWAWALLGLLTSLATSFTFGVPYLLLFAALWLLVLVPPLRMRLLCGFVIFALTLIVAESPQLFGVLANASISHRAGWTPEALQATIDGLFYRQLQFDLFAQDKILDVVTRLLPGPILLAGVVPTLIALRSVDFAVRNIATQYLRVVALLFLLAQKWLWLSLQSVIALALPWVNGIHMGRFFEIPAAFLIAVALAHLASLAWRTIPARMARRTMTVAVILFLGFMIIEPKRHLFAPLALGDWGQDNYDVVALAALPAEQNGAPIRVASVLPLQPAYAYAQGLETADGWANIYPRFYRELWLRVLDPLFNALPATAGIFGRDSGRAEDNFIFLGADLGTPGIGLLPDEDAQTALRDGFDIDKRFNLNLLRLLGVNYLLSEYPLRGDGIELVHAPLEAPTWLQTRDRNTGLINGALPPLPENLQQENRLIRTWLRYEAALAARRRGKDIFAYHLQGAVPRVRLAREVVLTANARESLDRLSMLSRDAIMTTAVIESSEARGLVSGPYGRGNARIQKYEPSALQIAADGNGQRLLIVANSWSPYWRAESGGHQRHTIRINHAQIGIVLQSEDRVVTLRYTPPYKLN